MSQFVFLLLKVFFFLTFPFIILIRGSVFFHSNYEWSPWLALTGGIGITAIAVMIYLTWVQGKFTGKWGSANSFKFKFLLAAILVLGYSAHGLLYLSDANAKSKTVKKRIYQFTSNFKIEH